LINGTQFISAIGAEAVVRAENLAKQADIIAALTVDTLKGTVRAFDPDIHSARPHKGQSAVAARVRSVLHSNKYPSELNLSHKDCGKVQDSYSLRTIPQVHGITHDTIAFVNQILTTELNSATDNPMVILAENNTTEPGQNKIISGGNFHGEYPAKACDFLAIGVHELANISERRIDRLVNPALNQINQLPAFLVKEGGLNSGFMIAHVTAAALVSENKVLCHPSSIDSLPTSAGQEDHVSMGAFAARKALTVVENVEFVLAIELLCACQALDFERPLKTTTPLEAVYNLVRTKVKTWDKDRFMSPEIESVTELIRTNQIWKTVEPFITNTELNGY